ncbi:hypothetical protein QWJ46_28345 [Rhizobium sp. CBN3]|uniref:hypothetical protein n=1 Tax=Rhizobium sp. CBN3 TaxID=3058045 RepID=UPI00267122DD|nr:hypothetical protein [Rhizobium sp. CBN3]MDO3436553.1 hypothetical protein [Rhizobium sp. CBN3]
MTNQAIILEKMTPKQLDSALELSRQVQWPHRREAILTVFFFALINLPAPDAGCSSMPNDATPTVSTWAKRLPGTGLPAAIAL